MNRTTSNLPHQLVSFFCSFRRQIRHGGQRERGQAIVITAIAFLAILAFAGLVTDAGSLYLNFTRLKRGLDSAAVAAANNIKDSSLPVAQRNANIREAAREMLALNNVEDIYSLETYTCEDSGLPAGFASLCPAPGEDKRKLAWVQATQNSPVYFLQLFGVTNVPITTHSVGEAASIDLVLVIDTSESMGNLTPGYDANFDPAACNTANDCQPLRAAKDAAKGMIDKLFDEYDRIAVVNFDFSATANEFTPGVFLEADHTLVKNAIDSIDLHDDVDLNDIIATGSNPLNGELNPLDINGDAQFTAGVPSGFGDSIVTTCTGCGMRVAGDILRAQGRIDSVWVIVLLSDGATNVSDLPDSGDPRITPDIFPDQGDVASGSIGPGYTNGFCGGDPTFPSPNRMWDAPWCTDSDPSTRNCGPYHANVGECPPGANFVGTNSPPYDAEDYARDITDRFALLMSANSNEPIAGDEIAIYTIGFGAAAAPPDYDGEQLLRYMANIGDDNIRNPVPDIGGDGFPPDPCDGIAPQTSCGQYYYAPDATYLTQIFEKIAGSIFTRISQ
jgi:hypothetical protein